MELNILLRGQSNAIFFDRFGGYAAVQADVERLLGFDGVNQTVNLLGGEAPDAAGWATTFGGTALLPPSQYHWLDLVNGDYTQGFTPAVYEQSLLNYIADLPLPERAAPTVVLFMQDESDASVAGGETTAEWTDAVRYEAGLVRNALGQTAATVPYLFVPVPFDSADPATMQAIRLGQDELSADATFNGLTATRTGDVDMNNPYNGLPAGTVIFGGPHLNEADVALLAARIAPSVADALAQYALPGSPVALAGGHVDDSGPQAVRVDWTPTRPTQVIVTLQDDPSASGLMPLGTTAASGLGWTIRDGATSIAASAAEELPGNQLMLTFTGNLPIDSAVRLFYDYGTGRLAVGADTHTGTGYPGTGPGSPGAGNGIYDDNGLPAWSAAAGVPITTATVALVVSAGVVAPAVTLYEGDTQTILDGGTGQDTTALTGSLLTISSGGSATGAALDGGEGVVAFGGTVTRITLNGGAISVAGAATGTTVSSGAETVLSGGIETGGTILSGGSVGVSGGTVNTEVVGGSLTVDAGGFVVASTILGGGNIRVHDGGMLTGHFENDGDVVFDISGNSVVNAGFSGTGSLTVSGGGTLTLAGVSSLSGILNIDGGTLELLTAGAGGSAPITFNGNGQHWCWTPCRQGVSSQASGLATVIRSRSTGLGATPSIGRAGDIVTLSDGNSSVVLDVAGSEQYGFEALPGSGRRFHITECSLPDRAGHAVLLPRHADHHDPGRRAGRGYPDRGRSGNGIRRADADPVDWPSRLRRQVHSWPSGFAAGLHRRRCIGG